MTEHTPTPWEVRYDGWQPWKDAIQILSADGEIIAYTTSGGLIVKAVNNHDALVTALRRISSLEEKNVTKYAQDIAREALAKAST